MNTLCEKPFLVVVLASYMRNQYTSLLTCSAVDHPLNLILTVRYEHLSGLGGLNGWDHPAWPALTLHDFNYVDVIGLTVYPFFNASSAKSLPTSYFQSLFDVLEADSNAQTIGPLHMYPLLLSETGWPSQDTSTFGLPWNCSPEEQVVS